MPIEQVEAIASAIRVLCLGYAENEKRAGERPSVDVARDLQGAVNAILRGYGPAGQPIAFKLRALMARDNYTLFGRVGGN
jgi:hypothetical protein